MQLSDETLGKLYDFADLVVETKQFGNLISAKDSEKFLSRHIADSLVPYIYIVDSIAALQNDALRWADMGAGAGCPVFPLAIAMPGVQFYAVEPRHMRVEFMNYAKEKLGLKNMTVGPCRPGLHQLPRPLDFRKRLGTCTARTQEGRTLPHIKKFQ